MARQATTESRLAMGLPLGVITGTTVNSTVAYWGSTQGVIVNLTTGFAKDGFGGTDTLINIHSVQGSFFSDSFIGSSGDDQFHGGGGNDTFVGGGGNDKVVYYFVKSTDTKISYSSINDTFTVQKNFANGDKGMDTLTGISSILFSGSGSDDVTVSRNMFAAVGGFLRSASTSQAVFPNGAWPTQFKAGDFNGDGYADYLITTQIGAGTQLSPMFVFLGDGTGKFTEGTNTIFTTAPMGIVGGGRTLVGDFNKDGISDVMQLDFGIDSAPFPGGLNRLYLSSTTTHKLEDVSASLTQQVAQNHALSAGDVNGDGYIDLLINSLSNVGNSLYLNDGTGHFVLRQDLIPHPTTTGGGALTNTSSGMADVNADGYLDLILGRWDGTQSPSTSQVLLNDGAGNFNKSAPISLPPSKISLEIVLDIKSIDLNGDDLPDLMLSSTHGGGSADSHDAAYYNTAYIQLLVNQGGGHFTDESATRLPTSIQDGSWKSWFNGLTTVDFNHDGYADILATASLGGNSVVLMNRGDGSFYQDWVTQSSGISVVADVNNDGMTDLLTNTGNTSYVDINTLVNGHIYKASIEGRKLTGSSGNDTFIGSNFDDVINGGAGIDTAVFKGTRANHTTTDGTDTLINIERLKFSDVSVALDLDGNAGQVAKILGAVFGAKSLANKSYVGIGLAYIDGGMSYEALCALAMQATGTTSHAAIVNLLWKNVIGTPINAGDQAYFVGLLDSGMSTGTLTTLAADTFQNATNIGLFGLHQTGIEYLPFG
jgi:FG-GAP-like repeat/RTX calcium-binding nonapeptide repeat (4 copies)